MRSALPAEQDNLAKLASVMPHPASGRVARGAAAGRTIRTPTSWPAASTPQHVHQAEEDRLVRVPPQQPVDQLAAAADDLARQAHEGVDERLELHPQEPALLRLVLALPPARPLRQRQRPPRLQVPRQ